MSAQRIVCLAVLAVLLVVCFLSDRIADRFVKDREDKAKRLSLIIKGAVLAVAVVIFLAVFI